MQWPLVAHTLQGRFWCTITSKSNEKIEFEDEQSLSDWLVARIEEGDKTFTLGRMGRGVRTSKPKKGRRMFGLIISMPIFTSICSIKNIFWSELWLAYQCCINMHPNKGFIDILISFLPWNDKIGMLKHIFQFSTNYNIVDLVKPSGKIANV